MIKIETQLDPNDPRIPENGVNKIPSVAYYYVNDVYYQTLDGEKLYHSDGKALSVYHVNGQREVNFELETYSRFFLDCTSEFIQGSVVQEYIDWNYNVHMDFYGFYLGEVSGLDYSMRGGCNERIESEGKIVTVPLVLKRGDKIVAIGDIKYYIERDSNGEIVGEQIGYDIKCW